MPTAKNYYQILEVQKGADEKTVKASYRRLARKFHPDLNPNDKDAEARFKEVNEAYEVLGDPEKKKLYDTYGSNWENAQNMGAGGGGGAGGFNVDFDSGLGGFFEQFFGGTPGPQGHRPKGVDPRDLEKTVELTLEEIATGTKRALSYQVLDACKSCDGTGYVRLRQVNTCPACRGSGQIRGMLGMPTICPQCEGTGQASLEKCPTCRGTSTMPTNKKVEVKIPAGIHNGKKLRVPGHGSSGSSGRSGDLYVVVKELPHEKFKRTGDDIETEVSVPYVTAALGGEIRVPTLDGSLTMKVPECTQSGQTFRLAGKGMPVMGRQGQAGNLFAKVKITMPKQLDEKERDLLRQLQEVKVER